MFWQTRDINLRAKARKLIFVLPLATGIQTIHGKAMNVSIWRMRDINLRTKVRKLIFVLPKATGIQTIHGNAMNVSIWTIYSHYKN